MLVKLSVIWDKKLLLSRKRNLRDFKMKRLFLREDVPPDHKLRQRSRSPTHNPPTPKSREKVTSDQNPSFSSAGAQAGVLATEQPLALDLSPSPSASASSLTSSSGATVVLDEANSDG